MKVKTLFDYVLISEQDNPFLKQKTESGIIMLPGTAQSQETGDIESLSQVIGFGFVEEIGSTVTTLKVGDGVFYDRRSVRPIPLDDVLWHINEKNIIGYIDGDSEELKAAYDKYTADKAEIEAQAQKHFEFLRVQNEKRLEKLSTNKLPDLGVLITSSTSHNA